MVVATSGYLASAFDLVNVRDLDLIRQARALCSRLVVGVFTDEFVEQVTGRAPVVPYEERRALVARFRGVDEAVAHAGEVDLAGHAVVFAIAGAPGSPAPQRAVRLIAGRESASPVLRDALKHQYAAEAEAVA